MKTLIHLTLAVLMLPYLGCEKQIPELRPDQQLIGEWEYLKAVGGFSGNHVIYPPDGSKTVLMFTSNHNYKKTVNNETVEEGVYKLVKVNSIFTGKEDNAIKFNGSPGDNARIVSIRNDSLWLSDNHVEPYSYLYIRLR